ncbi:MAG TPA: hypothetical protein VFK87_06165 [Steroidobacteraceae bacterium]|nr:hypothetical protein [Steroidobacteraceae bacterium]
MRASILLPAVAALGAAPALAGTTDIVWRDFESRIQYGYYTEDARSLQNLTAVIAADESHGRMHGYYAGLLAWRRAQLAAAVPAGAGDSAAQLSDRCVDSLDDALGASREFAEGLALRATCRLAPVELAGRHGPLAARRGGQELEEALRLAPANPRVLLLVGLSDYQLPPALGGNKERALTRLRAAVAAFEAERRGTERLPGWGAAEAYFYLARDLLDHADPVGARDALERALLIAPEFAAAQRLMVKITGG